MTVTRAFDLLESPLAGTNLIEASAGTGKTYTIAGIYLRLILETMLSVDEILVVTFTVAATNELRDRLRRILRQALKGFSGGPTGESFLDALILRHRKSAGAERRLSEAIQNFDESAIFTIHGFCQKLLFQHSFESGDLFDTELLADETALMQEISDDFWRIHFFGASPLFVAYALSKNYRPDSFLRLLQTVLTTPPKAIIPEARMVDTTRAEHAYREAAKALSWEWPLQRREVAAFLLESNQLNRSMYRRNQMPALIEAMDHFVAAGGNSLFPGGVFHRLTSASIARGMKKGCASPDLGVFRICERMQRQHEELCHVYEQQLLYLKTAFCDYARQEMMRRKQACNVQSFNDLLFKANRMVGNPMGKEITQELRKRYRAALIDEFQDTDPVQYDIFSRLFQESDTALFLIGDPKQAIYGFRGADIFTYLKATREVARRYTLKENWRSEPALIAAINAIFSRSERPFVYEEIPFAEAAPPHQTTTDTLTIGGISEPPLWCWFVDTAAVGSAALTRDLQSIKKGDAEILIRQAVGAEIVRLLNLGKEGKACIGGRPIHAGDIAVLVRTNREARTVQEFLIGYHIPSVLHVTESLFDSHEAYEMERLLRGVAAPSNERLLTSALATDMIGLTCEELEELLESEMAWEEWMRRFGRYHDLWRKQGFMRMIRQLMSETGVQSRFLTFPDGERRLTNVLHLAEVLHSAATAQRLKMTGLLTWLAQQRNADSLRQEEHQLRLESDAYAVRIVTIHKSKGLEYPIVFCPFLWDGSRMRSRHEPVAFHAEMSGGCAIVDVGSPEKDLHQAWAEQETLAENVRLLYVALTRAKNRCYVVWGRFNEAETSALAYCLHFCGKENEETILGALESTCWSLTSKDVREALTTLGRDAGGTIVVQDLPLIRPTSFLPAQTETEKLVCRRFKGDIDRSWRICSFSSLTARFDQQKGELSSSWSDAPDHDEGVVHSSVIAERTADIFAFPRGTHAGLVIHEIFECLDFTEDNPGALQQLVGEKLSSAGFAAHWSVALCNMVKKVISLPLAADGLRLNAIPVSERISELEFYYPVQSISPEKLKDIFLTYGGADLAFTRIAKETLEFHPSRGFMKGFVDLLFHYQGRYYVVDWKSNFLGSSCEQYDQKALQEVMEDHCYTLQYCIYTLAIHHYLRRRLPAYQYAKHFGGVFYLFVRGIDPEQNSEYGVYRARPEEKLIEALSRDIMGIG